MGGGLDGWRVRWTWLSLLWVFFFFWVHYTTLSVVGREHLAFMGIFGGGEQLCIQTCYFITVAPLKMEE